MHFPGLSIVLTELAGHYSDINNVARHRVPIQDQVSLRARMR